MMKDLLLLLYHSPVYLVILLFFLFCSERILIERGFQNTKQLVLADIITILENHTDFQNENNALATLIENRGYQAKIPL